MDFWSKMWREWGGMPQFGEDAGPSCVKNSCFFRARSWISVDATVEPARLSEHFRIDERPRSAEDADRADLRGFLSRLRRDRIRLATKAPSPSNEHFRSSYFVSSYLRGKKLSPQAKENPRKSALSVSSALLSCRFGTLVRSDQTRQVLSIIHFTRHVGARRS